MADSSSAAVWPAQNFTLKNVGPNPPFSDFLVSNPESRRTYRVTVRGTTLGDNACTCPDFAAKTLGTRKHVEFVLAKLERSKKARAELKAGYQPAHAEVGLRYGSRRQVASTRRPAVRTDEKTGEPYLRLPVPLPQVLNQAVEMLSRLLGNLRNR